MCIRDSDKRLLQDTWHGNELDGLRAEERMQMQILGKNNQKEAVMSEIQKRAPEFEPRS